MTGHRDVAAPHVIRVDAKRSLPVVFRTAKTVRGELVEP